MDNAARFLTAVKEAKIERIVIIDDALAAPAIRTDDAGPLLDILGNVELIPNLGERGIGPELREAASSALLQNELEAEEVGEVWARLYRAFVKNEVHRMDPGGRFAAVKGDNAKALRPFVRLLSKCDPEPQVTMIGSEAEEADFKALRPQLVFLDYILDERVSATSPAADPAARSDGVKASQRMLERIVKDLPTEGPSVVLMSSDADVEGEEADAYRHKTKGHLFSSRFQFVPKGKVRIEGKHVRIESDAAGTLLDLTQCQAFGVELNDALNEWREGASRALRELFTEMSDLELRDIAYLTRFRLADEGQPLTEYLEWFFGELLLDRIGTTVDWRHRSFTSLNAHSDGPGRHIEGMFDGATLTMADMFSRVRVDRRKIDVPRDRRMGDLYMADGAGDQIQAVLTPDCDLMARELGPRAASMLTVTGQLTPIDAPNVTAADFIVHNGVKHSIVWNLKDLRTLPFGTNRAHPAGMVHVGTLRPLYALELQRRVLDDVGRVGLAVAPPVHFTASSEVYCRATGPLALLAGVGSAAADCSVMPSRRRDGKSTVVFHRGFVERLIDAITALVAPSALSPPAAASITPAPPQAGAGGVKKAKKPKPTKEEAWLKQAKTQTWQDAVMRKLCAIGIEDGEFALGMVVRIRDEPKDTDEDASMCQILVRPAPEVGAVASTTVGGRPAGPASTTPAVIDSDSGNGGPGGSDDTGVVPVAASLPTSSDPEGGP